MKGIDKNPKANGFRKKLLIGCSILLASILLFVGFMFAWNAGLGLPKGYKEAYGYIGEGVDWGEQYHPFHCYVLEFETGNSENRYISYSTKYNCDAGTTWVFPFQSNLIDHNRYFDYGGDQNFYHNGLEIYKTADDSLVGTFLKKEKEGTYKCEQSLTYIFIDDNYVYYLSKTRNTRFYFELPTDSGTLRKSYMKYEFYRFNLDDGQNEKIEMELFIEKINKYDETIKKR